MIDETPPVIAIVKKKSINSEVRVSPILDWTERVDANQQADQTEPARGGIYKNAFYHERSSALVLHIHMV